MMKLVVASIIGFTSVLPSTTDAQSVGIFSSIPAFWWEKFPDNPVQFDRPRTFQQQGIAIRSMMNPDEFKNAFGKDEVKTDEKTRRRLQHPQGGQGEGGQKGCIVSDWLGSDGCWDRRAQYLPMTFRATIVAVAPGEVFKGWHYYLENSKWSHPPAADAKQFLIMDEYIRIQEKERTNFDHGFYFRPIVGRKYPHAWPENFLTPVNYTEGEWFFRYEIINQPSWAQSGFQFCIWQDSFSREICAPFWDSILAGAPQESTKGLAPLKPWTPQGCADDWQTCTDPKCCKSEGSQCKQMSNEYAQCRPIEEECPPDEKAWTCEILTQKAPELPPTTARDTLGGTVANTPDTSRFWEMLETSGMSTVLTNRDTPMTVFAPSNAAIEKAMADDTLRTKVGGNGQKLNALLLQHIVVGEMSSTNIGSILADSKKETEPALALLKPYVGIPLVIGGKGDTLSFATESELQMAKGKKNSAGVIVVEDKTIEELEAAVNPMIPQWVDSLTGLPNGVNPVTADIVRTDMKASNGVLHIIDTMLVPEMTVGDVAPTVPPGVDRMESCAAEYESCLDQRCCQNAQFACLAKDTYWAQCRPAVDVCPPPEDPSFSCDVITFKPEDMKAARDEVMAALEEEKIAAKEEAMAALEKDKTADLEAPPATTTKTTKTTTDAKKIVTKRIVEGVTIPEPTGPTTTPFPPPSMTTDADRSYTYSEKKADMRTAAPSAPPTHYGGDGIESLLEKESRLRAAEREKRRKRQAQEEFDHAAFKWPFRR